MKDNYISYYFKVRYYSNEKERIKVTFTVIY